jgi:tetratricopeptide (TPR) repeat protein
MRDVKFAFTGILIFSMVTLMSLPSIEAQKKSIQRSPEDSLKCLEFFSVYSMALEKKMYNYAIGPWRTMFENCPDISTRVYADGVDLITHYLDLEKDEQKQAGLMDTLLMIYDQRIAYFGDHEKYPEGWILGRKGLEIVKYRRDKADFLQEAYRCFEKSYQLLGQKSEPPVMLAWMQTTRSLFVQDLLSPDSVFENFIRIHTLLSNQIAAEPDGSRKGIYDKVLSAVETIFSSTAISDCAFFTQYLANLGPVGTLSPEEIKRQIRLLQVTNCKDSELYVGLIEQDYKNAPDGLAAAQLARLFLQRQSFDDARKYYLEAIDKSDEDSVRALYCYELGVLMFGHYGEADLARKYTRQAASLRPEWGAPYMLLGSIYAQRAPKLSGNEFEQQAVYWVAVDQFMKVLNVDTTYLKEARKQIEVYSQYFPDQQSCFFRGLNEGQTFTVEGWVNESTVVRYRK